MNADAVVVHFDGMPTSGMGTDNGKLCELEIGRFEGFRFIVSESPPKPVKTKPGNKPYYQRGRW